jgi:energy-coupling factor transport system ATP-binding protein
VNHAPILSMREVSYTYPGASQPALADLSLEIQAGEMCLLAGLSGEGKSTLLRAVCGLVPHFHGGAFAGTVELAGLDTREHGPAELGGLVGVLFQDPETQLVMNSVRAELELALESRGQRPAAVARGVEEVALALGVDHLLGRNTQELSGGEKQRVALCAALAGKPRVVLLDEPTSQLDPVAAEELIGLLRRLNQEWEMTVVLAEHRLERCLALADRVLVLQKGRLAYDGDPESFLRWASLKAPELQTPGARMFALAGLPDAPVGVRQARTALRRDGLLADIEAPSESNQSNATGARPVAPAKRSRFSRARPLPEPALSLHGVWHELRRGPAILRGVELTIDPGQSVALMGRNGAGKSTLLRHAAGLMEPTRGRIHRAGRVALLLQNPGDYFLHDRVEAEVSPAALAKAGLGAVATRDPKDLSGGERQRLALAIVTDSSHEPAVLALDEPTRGMDRAAKAALAMNLQARARAGQAVIVATHDLEFAAACAIRGVLLADGRVIADEPCTQLLTGGWYFATETARILAGASGALLPEDGAQLLRSRERLERERLEVAL